MIRLNSFAHYSKTMLYVPHKIMIYYKELLPAGSKMEIDGKNPVTGATVPRYKKRKIDYKFFRAKEKRKFR